MVASSIDAGVADPREVCEEMVQEAFEAALKDAKEKAPSAQLEELLEDIGPNIIYKFWMWRLFKKKGSYGKQVAPWVKKIKKRMLAEVERVNQKPVLPCMPLSQKLTAELDSCAQNFRVFLDGFGRTIAAEKEEERIEVLREADVKQKIRMAEHERRVKTAEAESAEHLAAAASFELELDAADDKVNELSTLLAGVKEQLCAANLRGDLFAEQIIKECARADSASADAANANTTSAALSEQLKSARERVEQAEAARDAARNDAKDERILTNKANTEAAEARSAVAMMDEQLKSAVERAARAEADRDAAKREAGAERERADRATAARSEATAEAASLGERLTQAYNEIAALKDQPKGTDME